RVVLHPSSNRSAADENQANVIVPRHSRAQSIKLTATSRPGWKLFGSFEITPAKNHGSGSKDYDDVYDRVENRHGRVSGARQLSMSSRSNETEVRQIWQQVVESREKPPGSAAAHRVGETFQVRAEVSNDENEERQQC